MHISEVNPGTLCRIQFWSEPPKWLFFGINQNKLTQGVKTYKNFFGPAKIRRKQFSSEWNEKENFFFLNPLTWKFNVGHKCNFFLYDLLFLIFFRIKRKNGQMI